MNNFKAVIFDMDGVLIDSEKFYYEYRIEYLNKIGFKTDHLPASFFVGGKMRDTWPALIASQPEGCLYTEADIDKLQDDYLKFRKQIPVSYNDILFPDVRELLDYLKSSGYRLALASSSDFSQIHKLFADANLGGYFDVICSGEDFAQAKPNPAIYYSALEKLGLSADEVLIIEDSIMGIQAAKAVGAMTWALRDKQFGIDQSQADQIFDSLHDIKLALENFSKD